MEFQFLIGKLLTAKFDEQGNRETSSFNSL